jgi:PAS domain S-box-containing protein
MALQNDFELPPEYHDLRVGIAVYDPDSGTILAGNDRVETISGYTTEQLRDLSIGDYTANTYAYSETDFEDRLTASAAGRPQRFTWRIKRADGELVWVKIHLSDRTGTDRSYVRAEIRDITEHYETRHREELFWRVLRHNLRNEATALTGHASFIANTATTDTVREASDVIHARAEELGNIADSLGKLERAVVGTDDQACQRATTAVKDVVETVSARYPAAEITIDELATMWIDIDEAFTYALTEALENAILHSAASNPDVAVTIGPSSNTGRVEVRVRDGNSEIPAEEINALRTPAETTAVSHGSGVGLFVMKWCIESLGGEISFERSDPGGNTVSFYLPPKDPATGQR